MQKNGAGLHTASTCFWDTKTDGLCTAAGFGFCFVSIQSPDGMRCLCAAVLYHITGSCSVRWDNKTMHAIVTVFALHI